MHTCLCFSFDPTFNLHSPTQISPTLGVLSQQDFLISPFSELLQYLISILLIVTLANKCLIVLLVSSVYVF